MVIYPDCDGFYAAYPHLAVDGSADPSGIPFGAQLASDAHAVTVFCVPVCDADTLERLVAMDHHSRAAAGERFQLSGPVVRVDKASGAITVLEPDIIWVRAERKYGSGATGCQTSNTGNTGNTS